MRIEEPVRAGLTAVVAVLGIAACSASDARPAAVSTVATSTTVAPDALLELPEVRPSTRFVRLIPPAAASRGVPRQRTRVTSPVVVPQGDVWTRLALCESGMRNVRNPPYSGYFQFTRSTWQSLGYAGEAADHDYGTQLAAAKRLLARSGPGQWPVCSRKVGLR